MSLITQQETCLQLKVVYEGPVGGGKTASLLALHEMLDPEGRVKLVSMQTEHDRTLFCDFMPLDLPRLGNLGLRIQIYTVSGQVRQSLTRRCVLMGTDAVIFVATRTQDRRAEARASFAHMIENLKANGLEPREIPLVFQWGGRDHAASPLKQQLQELLGGAAASGFLSHATGRRGILEPFVEAVRRALGLATRRHQLQNGESFGDQVATYLTSLATSSS